MQWFGFYIACSTSPKLRDIHIYIYICVCVCTYMYKTTPADLPSHLKKRETMSKKTITRACPAHHRFQEASIHPRSQTTPQIQERTLVYIYIYRERESVYVSRALEGLLCPVLTLGLMYILWYSDPVEIENHSPNNVNVLIPFQIWGAFLAWKPLEALFSNPQG